MNEVIIKLSKEEAERMFLILNSYEDEGPIGEGWASDELRALCNKVASQINNQ